MSSEFNTPLESTSRFIAAHGRSSADVRSCEHRSAIEQSYAFEACLRGGRVLRFDGRVDPAELGAVVRALEAAGLKPGDDPC